MSEAEYGPDADKRIARRDNHNIRTINRFENARRRACLSKTAVGQGANPRLRAKFDQVALKRQFSGGAVYHRANAIIRHRQNHLLDPKRIGEVARTIDQRPAGGKLFGSVNMRGQIAIAKRKPNVSVNAFQFRLGMEGIALDSPTAIKRRQTTERIQDRVDIGADAEPEEIFVVGGINDDRQSTRFDDLRQSA